MKPDIDLEIKKLKAKIKQLEKTIEKIEFNLEINDIHDGLPA